MNIFVLDQNPTLCAQYHNDKHVARAIMEISQLLCTAHVYLDGLPTARARVQGLLAPLHTSHKFAVWVRANRYNYEWAWKVLCALHAEYYERFGNGVHSSRELCTQLSVYPLNCSAASARTPQPQAMPRHYHGDDVVRAYRRYYIHDKAHLATWSSPAKTPKWWLDMEQARYYA